MWFIQTSFSLYFFKRVSSVDQELAKLTINCQKSGGVDFYTDGKKVNITENY